MVVTVVKLLLELLRGKAGFVLFAGKNLVGGAACFIVAPSIQEAIWAAAPFCGAILFDIAWYGLAMLDFSKVRRICLR